MKYFSPMMTLTEAKTVYRTLAKEMHPDIGGDEEAFKALANEYAAFQRQMFHDPISRVDDAMAAAGLMVDLIVKTLVELYPRTRLILNYTPSTVNVDVYGNVPLKKMIHIESIINSFRYPFLVTLYFQRNNSKKWYPLETRGNTTFINMTSYEEVSMTDAKSTYTGARYSLTQNRRYERCEDKKENHIFLMCRTPKFSLKELLKI